MTCPASKTIGTAAGTFWLRQLRCGGVVHVYRLERGAWRHIGSRHTWERAESFAQHYESEAA